MNDTITLSRKVVEQLVKSDNGFVDYHCFSEMLECKLCQQSANLYETVVHLADCPVRLAQDALREQSNDH